MNFEGQRSSLEEPDSSGARPLLLSSSWNPATAVRQDALRFKIDDFIVIQLTASAKFWQLRNRLLRELL